MSEPASALETLPAIAGSESLADQVYSVLRTATRRGVLTPGQKVTERQLADQLDVSPTPVREALRQLVHEGLFERTGPRSLRVAEYEKDVRREIAEAEAALCGLAARLAARKVTSALINELEAILDESDSVVERLLAAKSPRERDSDVEQILTLMRRFHHRIETSTGNAVIEGLLSQSRAFTDDERHDRTLITADRDAAATRRRYDQHRDILSALRSGDESLCERITIEHHLEALAALSGL